MVLYYSATGNTAYIAQQLAQRLDDTCMDLLKRIKQGDHSPLHSDTPFVICAPVYVCEMPRFLARYLKEQTFTGSREVYFIFTSGGYCGIAGKLAKRMMGRKGMQWLGHSEFKMPRNYVASNAYPMQAPDEVAQRLTDAHAMLDPVADTIRTRGRLKARHAFLFETLVTLPVNPVWCKYKLTARAFTADQRCVSCGKCAALCPLNNVRLANGLPQWGDQCTHCMACIANCPTGAIEYGDISRGKERYTLSRYRHVVDELDK